MTQVQKTLSAYLRQNADCNVKLPLKEGMRVYISKNNSFAGIDFKDKYCGAYGKVYLENEIFSVPKGFFINLCGALNLSTDVSNQSGKIANYILKNLISEDIRGASVEFGGDSMGYLTMEDRFAVVKKLSDGKEKPFCTVFECDYISAEYTLEKFGEKPAAYFNDGPESYCKVIDIDLCGIA